MKTVQQPVGSGHTRQPTCPDADLFLRSPDQIKSDETAVLPALKDEKNRQTIPTKHRPTNLHTQTRASSTTRTQTSRPRAKASPRSNTARTQQRARRTYLLWLLVLGIALLIPTTWAALTLAGISL